MVVARSLRSVVALGAVAAVSVVLAGCEGTGSDSAYKAFAPIPKTTLALMADKGTSKDAATLIRAYKKEAELEVWKRKADGTYTYLKTYPMCRWSGQLGPKKTEGDRQVPEGFYTITPGAMNPNSHYYLSFNVGYPNAYDRANGASGGSIMVHGICSSAGCFSMTDKQIEEIYAIARESFAGGQRAIQMQSMPFRMTADNLAKMRLDPNMPFWREIKKGADYFDVAKAEPAVGVCNRHYVFGATPKAGARFDALEACPPVDEDATLKAEVASKAQKDDAAVAELVGKGIKPVRLVYADGGQHDSFAHQVAEVSRPDALAAGATEIALDDNPRSKAVATQVAAAKAKSKALLAKGNVISPVAPALVAATAVDRNPTGGVAMPSAAAPSVAAPAAPAKVAQAEGPAMFDAAPSAYARTPDGGDKGETKGFFKKWLSFGEAPKPEALPAIAATEQAVAGPAPTPADKPQREKVHPRGPAKAASSEAPKAAEPAKATTGATVPTPLPKQITGRTELPRLPKGVMALVPAND